jgi:3-oxoacyl-[acyl-carrier protein] reductase
MTAAMIPRLAEMTPLRRIGQPAEIAAMVSYLVSEEAGYMTGSSLTIDGGFAL